jgi:L-threonylcarbamoyladenylate synthase
MQTIIGKDIDHAAELLREGEIVAIPTETVYGLAGNALSENAVLKIYEAKDRPRFNPLIIHIASVEQMGLYSKNISDKCLLLAKKYSPGPITFLLTKKDLVPDLVTAGSDKVAIRIPDHPLTLQLLKKLDFPLAAPSANPSGYVSPVTAQHVLDGLNNKISYILDGGECKVGVESTIVGFENDDVIIHRLGGIGIEEIEKTLQQKVRMKLIAEEPESSGQLKSHYATNKPLYYGDIKKLLQKFKDKKAAVITLNKSYEVAPGSLFQLSGSGNLHEAASNLFKVLRMIDRSDIDVILADRFPDEGLGRAINDRLQKAQHVLK